MKNTILLIRGNLKQKSDYVELTEIKLFLFYCTSILSET